MKRGVGASQHALPRPYIDVAPGTHERDLEVRAKTALGAGHVSPGD
jgi:hypothetical protein